MQKNIYLPNVELNMEGVTVTGWLVNVGDQITVDQAIMEVETQKATIEVPSPEAGHVRAQYVRAGDEVGEKALLCVVTDSADEPFTDPRETVASSNASTSAANSAHEETTARNESGIAPAAPAARKLAKELGVDLAQLRGSGPGGRITVEDVQTASTSAPQSTSGWSKLPAARVALNQQMQKSLTEIPQIHIARQMDVTTIAWKQEGSTFTHRLIKAVAAALARHPALRTIIEGNQVKEEPVSVAVAMDTPHGLVAPALRAADTLTLEQIAAAVQELQSRAESNSLRREELINAPFAITNLGMLGVDFFQPFVFHGQTAVLAIGRAIDVTDSSKTAWFNLGVDHRVVDGAEAARFLETLQQEISKS